jgi:hypothetical protein
MPPLKLMKKELLPRAGEVKGDLPSPERETRGGKSPLTKFLSYRTQQAIAQFGKSARHSLCQAWLSLREREQELSKAMEDAFETGQLLLSEKQLKKRARALYEQFYKEGKQKEVIRTAEIVRELGEHFPEVRKSYRNLLKVCDFLKQFHEQAKFVFALEQKRAEETGDTKATRALQSLKKTVNKPMNNGQKRVLGILEMLRDKVVKGTAAKDGGATASYRVYASCGDRPLSDEVWQGRLTVKEMYSHLLANYGPRVAGDKDGKEIRRTMRRLGIRPAEDERGRKWKPPLPKKQEPKRPRGRTRAKPEIKSMSLEAIQAMLAKTAKHGDGLRNQQIYKAGDESGLKWARKVLKSIDREIAQLVQRRGGRRGKFVY